MLLLTDAPTEALPLKQIFGELEHCTMLPLDQACRRPAVHPMIACHVEFGKPATQALLNPALSHHRTDPNAPVLFLMRDMTPETAAQAEQFGATEILPRDASREQLLFWIKRCKIAHKNRIYGRTPSPGPSAKPSSQEAIESLGQTMFDLMQMARQHKAISIATLERGAEMLLTSVKQVKMSEWLDVVRRYDDATYQHCLIVAGLVASFSIRLGLSVASQHMLGQAALLHDIGKAHVPQKILNKPGPLTADEMAVMRRHPVDGHKLLAGQPGLNPGILDVVRHHHEMLDGSGYPDRLQGAQVSEIVRLVTICDIYAALIERRSYKAPMSAEKSRAVLHEMGRKLDVGLLKAFDDVIYAC